MRSGAMETGELCRLVRRAGSGEADAFTPLVRRFQNMAFAYATSLLGGDFCAAQDATQEAFLAAFQGIGRLREPAAFPAWLRAIVRRHCVAMRGTGAEQTGLDEALEASLAVPGPSVEAVVDDRNTLCLVQSAIAALPPTQREVSLLYFLQEYTQPEIAAFLQLPVTTVNNRLHAARKRLRRRLIGMISDALKENALPEDFAANIGRVLAIRAGLVDVQFRPAEQPEVFDLLAPTGDRDAAATLRVIQRIDGGIVRCLPFSSGDFHAEQKMARTGKTALDPITGDTLAALVKGIRPAPSSTATIGETGIKAIDLLCPIPTNGRVALLGGFGVGANVLVAEIRRRLGVGQHGLSLFYLVPQADAVRVEGIRAQDAEFLGEYDRAGEVQTFWILTNSATDPMYAVEAVRESFDAAVFLSPLPALQGFFPALDPLHCRSRIAENPSVVGEIHVETVRRVREEIAFARQQVLDILFYEYIALRADDRARQYLSETVPNRIASLPAKDQTRVARARKLERYLTQPFYVAETYTGRAGKTVSREQTVQDCRDILDGAYDDVPESSFLYIGAASEARRKTSE